MIAERLGEAVHVRDRFHVMQKFGKAIDEIRAEEARKLQRDGYEPVLEAFEVVPPEAPED